MSIIEKFGTDKTTIMKTSWLLLFLTASLYGCNADTSTNNESDKETQMFGKQSEQTYVIFSPLQGVLMQNGKPLANTRIIRRLRWNGNDEEGLVEEFMTDEAGRFSLPVHEEQLSMGMLTQFVGNADLEYETASGTDYLWSSSKFYPDIYSETDGEVEGLVCDIDAEEIAVPMGPTSILTRCRWSSMPDPDL